MIATVEINKIFKSGCVDNSQVCCIADALVGLVDEGFACRFVNKQLDETEIMRVGGLPSSFPVAKFVQVNQVWRRQWWVSKHRLAGVQSGSVVSKCQVTRIHSHSAVAAKGAKGVLASGNAVEAERIKNELIVKLDRVNDELKTTIEAKAKAEAAAVAAQQEKSKLVEELDAAKNDAKSKGKALDAAKKKMVEAVRSLAELKAEKEKNDAMISQLKAVFPEDVAALGAKLAKAMPDTAGSRRVIYLYLAIITSDQIEEATFGNRFKLFDDELYLLFKDDPTKLQQARDMFAADINGRLSGQRVTWDFLGEPFDPEKFSTSDSFGTEVTEVIAALITKVNGSVVRRARVKTEDIITEN